MDFSSARFSPDGAFLALILKNISYGDPEQVWLYEMRSEQLKPITERPRESVRIRDLAWSDDDTLYISAERIVNSVGRVFFVAATMVQVKEIDQLPPKMAGILRQLSPPPLKPSPTTSSFQLHCCEQQNDRYAVRLTSEAHGNRTLSMRAIDSSAWVEIARGGFELETFLFDPIRSEVLYPDLGKIIDFDLQTRQSNTIFSLNDPAIYPWLLDRTQDGTLVSYIEPGVCLGKARSHYQIIEPPRRVCFAKLK